MLRFRRNVPTVDATSSADIAFSLLLFFLLAGSFVTDGGILYRLFPDGARLVVERKRELLKRDVLTFTIAADDTILMEGEPVEVVDVRDAAKFFLSNPDNLANLPEKTLIDVPEVGEFSSAVNAVIRLEVSCDAGYGIYLRVFGELLAAYDDLRNELSLARFGEVFSDLGTELQTAVRLVYPVRIREVELGGKEVSGD